MASEKRRPDNMKLSEFNYSLPKDRIAQKPKKPRDQSRLLVLERLGDKIEHRHFYDLPKYLRRGDVLVVNDTRVMPARLIGRRKETGGKVEIFLLRPFASKQNKAAGEDVWLCLVGGPRRKEGLEIIFDKGLKAGIVRREEDGTWLVRFNKKGAGLMKVVEKIGQVPLPPYIKRLSAADRKRYQTVYADVRKSGSVAAPTAGLHFTPALINKLKKSGVNICHVTLHVGLGTFAPVKTQRIENHKMHEEYYEIEKKMLDLLWRAKLSGKRVIAVGTTSTRVLETVFSKFPISPANGTPLRGGNFQFPKKSKIKNQKSKIVSGWTDIFIYPGYKFKAVDALVTNFHLPKSTLLMLVSAFAQGKAGNKRSGLKMILEAYRTAIGKKYDFFSYGDAMLIK
jgi:S-adenosylmethionine:tRNA ribosyltransferase-isomerase